MATDPKTPDAGEAKAQPRAKAPDAKVDGKTIAEITAQYAGGGLTATDKPELTPAQIAAAQFELRKSTTPVGDRIWSKVDDDASASQVRNRDPNLDYRVLDSAQYPADGRRLFTDRQALLDRDFEVISGPLYKGPTRREFVSVGTAEIWARSIDLADEEFRVRLARSCLNPRYADHYFRRCVAEDAPEKRHLPEGLEYAMLVHHGYLDDSKRLMTKPGHARDLERERGIIIALARQVKVRPNGAGPDPVREAFATFAR